MNIFDGLTLIGGLCLFLFGMNLMGEALERSAGGRLQNLLGKLTSGKIAGFLTGLGVTAVIQSSSATTVMVVGFVNSGLMSLKQAINVIMGANVGTTVTAWLLSLVGIEGDNVFINLLKPTSFTPILAVIGIVLYMFCKRNKKKDVGIILLGFAVLMFGMETMTGAVSGLRDVPAFQNLFLMFENPLLGVLAGAVLTAVIQSSSASVGILQALSSTGAVTWGSAIPIIMGQNIGTCVTALLSSFGTNRNAKRTALVHLLFNIIGTFVWLSVFWVSDLIFAPELFDKAIGYSGIAVAHSTFNILCTALLLPLSSLLEKLAYKLVPETKTPDKIAELDERLINTPSVALERCYSLCSEMAEDSVIAMKESISCLFEYDKKKAERVSELEEKTDHYEDIIGTYLVKLSAKRISERDSSEAAFLLKIIGDLERISDHAENLVGAAEELYTKKLSFSEQGRKELSVMTDAISEILDLSFKAFSHNDTEAALDVEPLEQVIDGLKEKLRSSHIVRLQQGLCGIETGFVWTDVLTDFERTSDHCSNIAGGVLDSRENNLNLHETLRQVKKDSPRFKEKYAEYASKYTF